MKLDKHLGNITPFGDSLLIDNQKLWRWYHDHLSGFLSPEIKSKRHQHDLKIRAKGKIRTIRVPIFELSHFGEDMAIDEKQIGGEMHTILSNRKTGKIALMACTLKASELILMLEKFNHKGYDVKSITRDLSQSYDWFCRQAFANARHVADKFHIIKENIDAVQDVRVRYRQELLTLRRKKLEEHKISEKIREEECIENNTQFKPNKFTYKEKKASNGETLPELLARSRYLLYKFSGSWNDKQQERAKVIFEQYPDIEKAYNLSSEFRNWYKKDNVGADESVLLDKLKQWYKNVENANVSEMQNFKSLVERHQGMIMNYFDKGETNAIAEGINSQIQRFVNINKGTRDLEFFYFRLANHFSPTPQNRK